MTQPHDVVFASKLYQDWLTELKERAMLSTHNQAQAIIRAVMYRLRRYLTTEDVVAFANALPALPRGIFIEGWTPGQEPAVLASADTFTREVIEDLTPHVIPPDDIVTHVFAVWSAHSTKLANERMKALLPAPLKALWPNSD